MTRPRHTQFEMTITEGRYRQVRRMVETLGARVLELVRVRIGGLEIGSLPIGKWRHLTPQEVRALPANGRLYNQPCTNSPGGISCRPFSRSPC